MKSFNSFFLVLLAFSTVACSSARMRTFNLDEKKSQSFSNNSWGPWAGVDRR